MSIEKDKSIYVAGHNGLVGSAILRQLNLLGYKNVITRDRSELDLLNQAAVAEFFSKEKIDVVYLAAAKVGGINANNSYPADFIYQNLMIQNNVIYQAFLGGVKSFLFLGSSCIYPRVNTQPMIESSLLTGKLEPTNEPYAIAKIAGIKLCESLNRQFGFSHGLDYRSIMPTNIYGPGDNFDSDNGHVIPSLIKKMHFAKVSNDSSITVWGSGDQTREFLYVDDMASACICVMNISRDQLDLKTSLMNSHINAGFGKDISIRDLAKIIAEVIGYKGEILFDPSKPDGAPRKLLDTSKIRTFGFAPKYKLYEGIVNTYNYFLKKVLTPNE